jgi:hypothetical protein
MAGILNANAAQSFFPGSLFANSEQGVWYDPSDMSTLFQDSAGTTPVTAVEQPVGLILDKSGRGNHASQSTSTARPVLSARYNLLTRTEEFDNAAWGVFAGASKTGTNVAIAPDGTTTADSVRVATSPDSQVFQALTFAAGTHTLTIYVKRNAGSNQTFRIKGSTAVGAASFSGTLTATDTWQQVTHTFTVTAPHSGNIAIACDASANTADLLVWGADLRLANDGVGLPVYQRVGAGTAGTSSASGSADYDWQSFPRFIKFDGLDDFLVTGNINFSGTDKISSVIGLRNNADSGFRVVCETSTNYNNVNGTINASYDTGPVFAAATKGSGAGIYATGKFSVQAAPSAAVFSWYIDRDLPTNDVVFMRKNGVAQAITRDVNTNPTGNFGDFPLYIGSRGGSSFQFNGRIYGLILRGAAISDAQIAQTETWINSRTRAF